MIETEAPSVEPRRTPWVAWLERPLSKRACVIGWIFASSIFALATRLAGGVTTSDSFVTVNSSMAIAHGQLSCAYPPQSTLGGNPLVPPLYPLISGALSALFRIGQDVAFPTSAQLGPHCSTAFSAIGNWIVPTRALFTTILLGYVGWIPLAVGVVLLLRATGRGRCVWEPITLIAVACAPPVIMCLHEYFHPQDLIAVGLSLAALANLFRQRWLVAGILLGLAFATQQLALLFFVPLVALAPRRQRNRLVAGFLAAAALIDVPIFVITSGRALKALFLGTGVNTKRATLLVQTHLTGDTLFALSRALPLVLGLAIALWVRRRFGLAGLEPITVLSVVAATLTLRLVFEVNLWGYYFMAVVVVLIMRQVIVGRVSWGFVLWLVVATYAAVDGGLANRPALAALPMSLWQVLLVPWILALTLQPIEELAAVRPRSGELVK
jgi:hypothetical protein